MHMVDSDMGRDWGLKQEAVERGGLGPEEEVKSSRSHNFLDANVDFGFESNPKLTAAEPNFFHPQSSSSTLTLTPLTNESSLSKQHAIEGQHQ